MDINKCDDKHILQMIQSFNGKSQEYIHAYHQDKDILELVKSDEALEQDLIWFKKWLRDNIKISISDETVRRQLRKIRDNEAVLQTFITAARQDSQEFRNRIERERPGLIHRHFLYTFFGEDLLDADDFKYIECSSDWQRAVNRPPTVDTSNTAFEDEGSYAKEQILGLLGSDDDIENNPYYELILEDPFDFKRFSSRTIEVGAIITGKDKVSLKMMRLFGNIRVCYASTQYSAAIIFCRSLVEEAVKEYIKTKTDVTSKKDIKSLWDKNLMGRKGENGLIDKLEEPLKSEIKSKIDKPREAANEILHRGEISEKEMVKIFGRPLTLTECTFESIKSTRDVIEELFP